MATPDLGPQVQTNASGPNSVTADGVTVQSQPVAATILADQYLSSKAGAKQKGRGLRFTKLTGPAQCPAVIPTRFDDGSF